ncbi:hypothetical protein LTR84_000009 [Exophiala bonariae]|uniref:Uncharacterized protein n=1 Tax=Exophiala bonariae TaxID=1690606 RepID=A0AAV9NSX9_9EURO|nr:hypothetical protein LTR84_000009 [Exophiala bonariae]
MGLRKSFPKERNYEFWNIMMCSLIQSDRTQADKDRNLFGTLAFRMISKAAETIPTDQEQVLVPEKAISTPEEVALLSQIFNSNGQAAQTVKLLQSETLNVESKVGKQDPQLILSLLLDAFEASEQWEEARSFCHQLLSSKPESQSDDRVWALWLKARTKLDVSDDQDQSYEELLESACSVRPISRASYIAKLQYLQTKDDDKSLDAIVKTCEEYADAFSTKAFCFDDLKGPLRRLNETQIQSFRDARAAAAEQNTLERLFALELEYSLLPDASKTSDLVDFAARALKLYHISSSEGSSQPCPEAAFLAVLAILRLGTMNTSGAGGKATDEKQQPIDHDHVLRAIILLETVRSSFEDYYQLTVVLIRLQAYLGLLSSAMTTFTKLSVKNMQYETVAHLILTRISSLHPSPITIPSTSSTTSSSGGGGGAVFDPLTAIETGLTVLENADGALVRGIREGLRFNSYSNIHNSVDMRLQLHNSASRRVYAVEERKLRRLRGIADDHTVLESEEDGQGGGDKNAAESATAATTATTTWSELADNRDFSYFPHFRDDDVELVQTRFRCGPLPRGEWVRCMALLDHVVTFFRAELTGQVAGAAVGSKALEHVKSLVGREETNRGKGDEEDGLTSAERWNLECHTLLAKAALLLADSFSSSAPEDDDIASVLGRLKDWLQKTISSQNQTTTTTATVTGIQIYTWQALHTSISTLETLQAVALLLGILNKKAKSGKGKASIPKPALVEIQDLVGQLEGEIHGAVRAVRDEINRAGVLGRLVDLGFARVGDDGEGADGGLGALGEVLELVSDEVQMETICGRIKDSWEDALDGVLTVKVKLWK